MFYFWLEALGFRLFVRKVANFMRDELILIVIRNGICFMSIMREGPCSSGGMFRRKYVRRRESFESNMLNRLRLKLKNCPIQV